MRKSMKIQKIKIKQLKILIITSKINNFTMIAVKKIMIELKRKKRSGKSFGNIKNKKIKKYSSKDH